MLVPKKSGRPVDLLRPINRRLTIHGSRKHEMSSKPTASASADPLGRKEEWEKPGEGKGDKVTNSSKYPGHGSAFVDESLRPSDFSKLAFKAEVYSVATPIFSDINKTARASSRSP